MNRGEGSGVGGWGGRGGEDAPCRQMLKNVYGQEVTPACAALLIKTDGESNQSGPPPPLHPHPNPRPCLSLRFAVCGENPSGFLRCQNVRAEILRSPRRPTQQVSSMKLMNAEYAEKPRDIDGWI